MIPLKSRVQTNTSYSSGLYTVLNKSQGIYLLFKSSESGSSSFMKRRWRSMSLHRKKKTVALIKFNVIFGEKRSTFTLA